MDVEVGRDGRLPPRGEQTKTAARRMWQDNQADISRRLPWPADQLADLVAYLERARYAR